MAEGGEDSSFSDLSEEEFEQSPLEIYFDKASAYLVTLINQLSSEQLLQFYALFKQAKCGPCTLKKPGFFDLKGKEKWFAWKNLGEMSSDQAMKEYIIELGKFRPNWNCEEEEEETKKSDTLGGPVVSTLGRPNEGEESANKSLIDWVKEGDIENVMQHLTMESLLERDEMGLTLLHWACDRGHIDIAKLLISCGANVNCQDDDGLTALHYASSCGHVDTLRLLLNEQATTTIKDNEGEVAADMAFNEDIEQILKSV